MIREKERDRKGRRNRKKECKSGGKTASEKERD